MTDFFSFSLSDLDECCCRVNARTSTSSVPERVEPSSRRAKEATRERRLTLTEKIENSLTRRT